MRKRDRPNYKEMSNKELKDLIKVLKFQISQSHSFHDNAKVRAENRSNLRKEIARIKTELNTRKNINE